MKDYRVFFLLVGALAMLAGCGTPMHRKGTSPVAVPGMSSQNELETGSHLLAADESEQQGYGLYSYLLFAARPTDANRANYLAAIDAVVAMPEVSNLMQKGFPQRSLNITSIPVRGIPPDGESSQSGQADAGTSEWVLEHYDYARARYLLSRLSGRHARGPYLVSTFSPLSGKAGVIEKTLRQDLSPVPGNRPDLTRAWVREFLERAGQPRLWDEQGMEAFVQKLRLAIAVVGESVDSIRGAMETLIKWTKAGTDNKS